MKLALRGIQAPAATTTTAAQPANDPNARFTTAKQVLQLLDNPEIATAVEAGRPNPQSLLNTDIGDGRKAYDLLVDIGRQVKAGTATADDVDNLIEVARVTQSEYENLRHFLNHRRDGKPYRRYDGDHPYQAAGFIDAFFMAEKKKAKGLGVDEPTSPKAAAETVLRFAELAAQRMAERAGVTEGSEVDLVEA